MSLDKREKQRFDKFSSHLRSLGRNKAMAIPSFVCAFCEKPLTSKQEVQNGYCDVCIDYLRKNLNNIDIPFPNKMRNQFVFR